MTRQEMLEKAQRDAKVARLLHPGQCCGNCALKIPLPTDGFFTGECGAITGPNGKPNGAPVVDHAGWGCLFWRARRSGGAGRDGR